MPVEAWAMKINNSEFLKEILTFDLICTVSAGTRFAGCAGVRCWSLRTKTKSVDSQERRTPESTAERALLTMRVAMATEIEWTETKQRYDRRKCGSCHLHSTAAAAFRHR